MLAFFTILHTGHECRKASHDLQQHRCLQGIITTHESSLKQFLQIIVFLFSILFSSWQQEPSSSTSIFAFSLNCSILLLRFITIDSVSMAVICHFCLSISVLLKNSSSSILLVVARLISSSFCFSNTSDFDSYFFKIVNCCCFRYACRANRNLSFCIA